MLGIVLLFESPDVTTRGFAEEERSIKFICQKCMPQLPLAQHFPEKFFLNGLCWESTIGLITFAKLKFSVVYAYI